MQVALAPPVPVRDRLAEARAACDALPFRSLVLVLSGLVALSATFSGLALTLVSGGSEMAPLALLAATPFTSFVVPGLLLAIAVGGTSCASFLAVGYRSPFALDLTLLAGGTLTLWIACEWAILRQASWLQVVYAAVGLMLLGIAVIGALRSKEPRHRWTVWVTAGEALGFVAPALAGVAAMGLEPVVRTPLVVLAGAIEGLLCGIGLAYAFPLPVNRSRFAVLTASAAALVWTLAMAVVALGRTGASPTLLMAALAIVIPLGLTLMGAAQWIELRHHSFRAHRWIAWSALAWALALPASFAPMPFVDETSPAIVSIVLWSSAGIAMAYVMSLVTWQGARRLAA